MRIYFLMFVAFALTLALLFGCGKMFAQNVGPAPQNLPPATQGLMVSGQYNQNPAAVTSGNQTPLQLDQFGNLKISLQGGTITGGGTNAVDATPFSLGASQFTPIGGTFADLASPVSANVFATFRMTAFRALHMNLRDASGNEYNAANPLPVTVANVNVPVVIQSQPQQPLNVNIAQVQGANAIGNALPVVLVQPSPGLPLQPCNQVRTTNCQHF